MTQVLIAIGPPDGPLASIEPVLQRSSLDVHRVEGPLQAIELCRSVDHLDLVLSPYPLEGVEIAAFLDGVRQARGTRPPLVLLLADGGDRDYLDRMPDEHLQVLSAASDPEELQQELLLRLGRRPRVAHRILVRLEVHLEAGTIFRACQTVNLSETGMLVRTSEPFPIGTMVQFGLLIEHDARPVLGMGEVVRHASWRAEKMRGLGMRFLRFRADGQDRLYEYLDRRQGEPAPAAT